MHLPSVDRQHVVRVTVTSNAFTVSHVNVSGSLQAGHFHSMLQPAILQNRCNVGLLALSNFNLPTVHVITANATYQGSHAANGQDTCKLIVCLYGVMHSGIPILLADIEFLFMLQGCVLNRCTTPQRGAKAHGSHWRRVHWPGNGLCLGSPGGQDYSH